MSASEIRRRLNLHGLRVLLVEEEYLLAQDLTQSLERHGAKVVGPVATVRKALSLIGAARGIDVAVLDIDVGGVSVFSVANALRKHGLPFMFATAFDPSLVPDDHKDILCWQKPFDPDELVKALSVFPQIP